VFASIGPLLYLVINTAKRYHRGTKIEQAHVVCHKSGCLVLRELYALRVYS
jgi:hypothetical protein